jgi:hypothetical protein
MFSGMMTAYGSELLSGAPDIDFNLGNKLGFYADIPITYKFTDHWALVVTPNEEGVNRRNRLTPCF